MKRALFGVLLGGSLSIKISSIAKLHEKPCPGIRGRQIVFDCIRFTRCCALPVPVLNEMPVRKILKGRCVKGRAKLPPREECVEMTVCSPAHLRPSPLKTYQRQTLRSNGNYPNVIFLS